VPLDDTYLCCDAAKAWEQLHNGDICEQQQATAVKHRKATMGFPLLRPCCSRAGTSM
jgi:hypothetical protein